MMAKAMSDTIQTAAFVLSLLRQPGEPVTLSYYGTDDGYAGQHHSAHWNGLDCGLPAVVDDAHFGTAAPYWVPLCARLVVCCGDKCLLTTVIDRQRDDWLFGKPHLDLWPAAARHLGMMAAGIVKGKAYGLH